jgi:hypothetical protein
MNALEKGLVIGLAILATLALFNAFTVLSMGSKLDTKIAQLKEAARAPSITLTAISAACSQCPDISPMIETIKASHVNITSEKQLDAGQAAQLISTYHIERLPAIIIEGEVEKVSVQNFETVGEGLVYQVQAAPYYNTRSKKVEGLVEAWILKANCDDCIDMQDIIDAFELQGVAFSKVNTLEQGTPQAAQLISTHKITRLPALMYSDEISAYPHVLQAMIDGGFGKSGDVHVYESRLPYVNVSTGKVQGLVDVTYLSDATCTECYDVLIHKQILERFGMTLGNEKNVDVGSAEGKSLVAKYSITSVPSVVIGGDVGLYTGFEQVWSTVGTIENDGSYIFRNNSVFSAQFSYKDLSTGQIVKPASAQETA